MSSELREAAQEYLALGLSVIALTGKTPNGAVHPHGLYDAMSYEKLLGTLSPEQRKAPAAIIHPSYYAPFDHPNTTGVGILTSFPYVVVDIDGEEGAVQWMAMLGGDPDLGSPRWVAKTGRGLHLWFAVTAPTGTKKLGPKLDLKGEGGYVVAPPSRHPDGGTYEWLLPPDTTYPPLEIPLPLQKWLDDSAFDAERKKVSRTSQKRVQQPPKEGWFVPQWGNEGILDAMSKADEGNRNHLLFWCAATLEEEGAPEEDFDALAQLALEAGLEARETRLTIRSGRRKAQ